jgi:hypothetical protein
LYHHKHGRFPPISRGRHALPATRPSAQAPAARPRTRGGVWRSEQPQNGLPSYTARAAAGELSLGTGRKNSTDEYELTESTSNMSTNGEGTTSQLPEISEPGEENQTEAQPTKQSDSLPPYVPPPIRAIVPAARVDSHQSASSPRR